MQHTKTFSTKKSLKFQINDYLQPLSSLQHPQQTLTHHCFAILKTLTRNTITCLAYHNRLLYIACVNEINVFDSSDHYSHVDTFKSNGSPSSGSIKSITFHGTKIFTAHQDGKIRMWKITELKRHRLMSALPTVKDRLQHSLIPGNYVHVRKNKKRLSIEHYDAVSGLAVKDGLVYSVSWDKTLKIWNTTSDHKCLESVRAHNDAINAVVVTNKGVVYTACADGSIKVWERSIGSSKGRKHVLAANLVTHKSAVNALALNGDGSILFSGSSDRSIGVWENGGAVNGGDHHDRDLMVLKEGLMGHDGAVLCLVNVGEVLVSGSFDRTVRIWQRGVGKGYECVMVMDGHEKAVKSLVAVMNNDDTYDSDDVLVGSGGLDGEIRLWRVCCPSLKYCKI